MTRDEMTITAGPVGLVADRRPFSHILRQLAVWVPFLAVAAYLIGQLTQGTAIYYDAESYGYVAAGLKMAARQDITGQIVDRNIGYPLFAALLTPHGGFRALVVAQAVLSAAGLAALLVVLRTFTRNVFVFAAAGLTAVLMAFASNAFSLHAQSISGEAPFGAFLALSLTCLVLACHRQDRARLWLLLGATASAYLAMLFKPNAMLVLPLCGGALAVAVVRAPLRTLNWRLIAAGAVFAVGAMAAQSLQHKAQVADWDFGPRTMFCSHLDQEIAGLPATPEGRKLQSSLKDIQKAGPVNGYVLLGYDPDTCFYSVEPRNAVRAVAAAAQMTDHDWLQQQFIRGVVHHPVSYALQILRQFRGFFANPDAETNAIGHSHVDQVNDVTRLAPYDGLIGVPLTTLNHDVDSWFARELQKPAQVGKAMIDIGGAALMGVILVAVLVALRTFIRRGRRATELEVAFLAMSVFILACITSVAATFTFDRARCSSAIAPLTFVWLLASIAFIVRSMGAPPKDTGA
jgi:hypothetical protein